MCGFDVLFGWLGFDQFVEFVVLLFGYVVVDVIGVDLLVIWLGVLCCQFGNVIVIRLLVGCVLCQLLLWLVDVGVLLMLCVVFDIELQVLFGLLCVVIMYLEYYLVCQWFVQVDVLCDWYCEVCVYVIYLVCVEIVEGLFSVIGQLCDVIVCGDFNSVFGSDVYWCFLVLFVDVLDFIDVWVVWYFGCMLLLMVGVYDMV